MAIQYIQNPSEQVQLEAVKQKCYNILHIHKPLPNVLLLAAKTNVGLTRLNDQDKKSYVKVIAKSKEALLELMKQHPTYLRFLSNQKNIKQIEFELVKENPYVIEFIHSPSEESQLEAIKTKPNLINYIHSPSQKANLLLFIQF